MSRMRHQLHRQAANQQVKVAVLSQVMPPSDSQQVSERTMIALLLGGVTLWAMVSLAIG